MNEKFESLYKETYKEVAGFVVSGCGNIDDVSDILQEIYLALFRNIDKANSKQYVMGIAHNKIKDFYRNKYRQERKETLDRSEEADTIEAAPDDFNVEEWVGLRYDTEKVWEYLRERPVIVAKVFYLYFYSGMTIKETAMKLGITESGVKNHLYRNLRELNRYLEREEK